MELDWLENVSGTQPHYAADDARRRLMRLGAQALTDGELVSVLLELTDNRTIAALVEGGLRALAIEHPDVLVEQYHLDRHSAARLLAAAELARRLPTSLDRRSRLNTPLDIYNWARVRLCGLRKEEFHVLCLNTRNVLLRTAKVAEGSVDQCNIDPREALAPAIACRASGIVLVHNHPAGDPEPSVNDVAVTRQLQEGARLLCIRLMDHVVIGERSYVSMAQKGLLHVAPRALLSQLDEPGTVDGDPKG